MERKYKICLVGAFGVGKTSVTRRFVEGVFGEAYLTTVGVSINTKFVTLTNGDRVKLVIWDVAGGDTLDEINVNYLRGAAGMILVVDGCRAETAATAHRLIQEIGESETLSPNRTLPMIALFNKADMKAQWELPDEQREQISRACLASFETSALSGERVNEAFQTLTEKLSDGGA